MGIVFDMPEQKYFEAHGANNTTIGKIRRSPAHCKAYMEEPTEATPSMLFGSAVHKLILEGDAAFAAAYHIINETDPVYPRRDATQRMIDAIQHGAFEKLFLVDEGQKIAKPRGMALKIAEHLIEHGLENAEKKFAATPTGINKRTAEGKEKYAEFQAMCEREGKTICKQEDIDKAAEYANWIVVLGERELVNRDDYLVAKNYAEFLEYLGDKKTISRADYESACKMRDTVYAHPTAQALLKSGHSEVTLFWPDADADFLCKARLDFLSDRGYIVDLKTTTDASQAEFSRSIAKFGYHRQNAMYYDGYLSATGKPAKGFVFIVVETKAPYAVGVYNLDLAGVEKGREEYKELLATFKHCMETGDWPAYSDRVETIELPRWYD